MSLLRLTRGGSLVDTRTAGCHRARPRTLFRRRATATGKMCWALKLSKAIRDENGKS